jgi:hypothetical protein
VGNGFTHALHEVCRAQKKAAVVEGNHGGYF